MLADDALAQHFGKMCDFGVNIVDSQAAFVHLSLVNIRAAPTSAAIADGGAVSLDTAQRVGWLVRGYEGVRDAYLDRCGAWRACWGYGESRDSEVSKAHVEYRGTKAGRCHSECQ